MTTITRNDLIDRFRVEHADASELIVEIEAAIAAAVQAERENGRIVEVALRSLIEEIDNFPGIFNSDSEAVIFSRNALEKYEDIQSAASRARSDTK